MTARPHLPMEDSRSGCHGRDASSMSSLVEQAERLFSMTDETSVFLLL